jgi:hypothetical protein
MTQKNKISYKNFLKKKDKCNKNTNPPAPTRTGPTWNFSMMRDWRERNFKETVLRNFKNKRFRIHHEVDIIDRDGSDVLFSLKDEEGKTHHLVRVRDVSTGRYHLLRVPREMLSCKQAIAWTFGMSEDEYDLMKES